MSPAELVTILEDLTDGMSVSDLRQGIDLKPLNDLSGESWAILVRFVGGERPDEVPEDRSTEVIRRTQLAIEQQPEWQERLREQSR